MSTSSTIAILNIDGTVSACYCHADGYLSYNGEMLYKHYKDAEKVKKLVSLGDISSLQKEIDIPPNVKHEFNARHPDITTFYHRDRGERLNVAKFNSLTEYALSGMNDMFSYLFDEKKNKWYFLDIQNTFTAKLVKQDLEKKIYKNPKASSTIKNEIDYIKKEREVIKETKKLNRKLSVKEDTVAKRIKM